MAAETDGRTEESRKVMEMEPELGTRVVVATKRYSSYEGIPNSLFGKQLVSVLTSPA